MKALGDVYWKKNIPVKAIKKYQECLDMRRRIHQDEQDRPEIAQSITDLAFALATQSEHRKAVKLYNEYLEIKRRTVESEDDKLEQLIKVWCLYQLGLLLRSYRELH